MTARPTIRWQVPDASLRHAVDGLWSFTFAQPHAVPHVEYSLPDGATDIILACSRTGHVAGFVRGPASKGTRIQVDGSTHYVGIRVRPGMARAVLGVEAAELRDTRVDLANIDGRLARSLAACASRTTHGTVARVHAMLRAAAIATRKTAIAAVAVPLIRNTNPAHSVRQVATTLGWSERKLHRHMSRELGLSPKLFMRIVRLQRALRLLRTRTLSTPVAAMTAGYADQAHMCREFLELTCATPLTLITEPAPLAFEDRWHPS